MMILDKIKSFFKRPKPVVQVAEEKPPEATIEKSVKTTQPQKKAPRTAKRRVSRAGKRKRTPCTGAIRSDLEADFFDEPRSTGEIKQRLSETGFTFTDSNVRNSLMRLAKAGTLVTMGRGMTLRYRRPG